jgi:hypothetical protein
LDDIVCFTCEIRVIIYYKLNPVQWSLEYQGFKSSKWNLLVTTSRVEKGMVVWLLSIHKRDRKKERKSEKAGTEMAGKEGGRDGRRLEGRNKEKKGGRKRKQTERLQCFLILTSHSNQLPQNENRNRYL